MITLGQIRNEIQADYIPNFNDLKAVRRGVKRVLGDINLRINGVDRFEDGLEMIVAPITEDVTFGAANQDITVTTDFSSVAEPGDVIVIYDSLYNSKRFTLSFLNAAVVYPVTSQPVVTEATVECTYAVYRPLYQYRKKDLVQTSVTYVSGGGAPNPNTITSVGAEVDFLDLGVKAGDWVVIKGAAESNNNALFYIVSLTSTILTTAELGKSGKITADATDPCTMTFISTDVPTYTYDLLTHSVQTDPMAKELREITENATELTAVGYETLKHDDYDDSDVYAMGGRLEAFLGDTIFNGAGDILRFNVVRDIAAPSAAVHDVEIDIPVRYEETLTLGVISRILGLPKYLKGMKDDYAVADNHYQVSLRGLTNTEDDVNPTTDFKLKYKY